MAILGFRALTVAPHQLTEKQVGDLGRKSHVMQETFATPKAPALKTTAGSWVPPFMPCGLFPTTQMIPIGSV